MIHAKLTGSAGFHFKGETGVTARIIRELREAGSDPRGWFEPSGNGYTYTRDFSHVSTTEYRTILEALKVV